MGSDAERWYCPRCASAREVLRLPEEFGAPWCQHNGLDLPPGRMVALASWYPLADGPLLWNLDSPICEEGF